jgi:hypothetical protein
MSMPPYYIEPEFREPTPLQWTLGGVGNVITLSFLFIVAITVLCIGKLVR